MKNSKNILFIITSIVLTTACALEAVPTFEIFNQYDSKITATVNQQRYDILPGSNLQLTIDTIQPITVDIVFNPGITPDKVKHTINAQGQTVYVSWNPNKKWSLYPQTGTLLGLMGTTKSGLSLNNNVTASQISATRDLNF